MLKTITITIDFPDDFTPPEKFDEANYDNHYNSKCGCCPFFEWEDETGFNNCGLPDFYSVDDKCPIKKYFY